MARGLFRHPPQPQQRLVKRLPDPPPTVYQQALTASLRPGASAYASTVMGMAPIAYYRLGDPSGTSAHDEVASNEGTYVGSPGLGAASLLVGDGDHAVTFNINQYATIPALALSASQTRTIAVWAALTGSIASQFKTLFVYGTVGTTGIFYLPAPSGNLRVFDGAVDMDANPAFTTVNDDTPHLFVAVYNGTAWTFSKDGSPQGTPVVGAAAASVTPSIGHWNGTNDWVGRLDEVAVWDRVLTDAEIGALYAAGKSGGGITRRPGRTLTGTLRLGSAYASTVLSDGPVAYWRLGEPSGLPLDLTGVNNMTVVGGAPTYGVSGAIAGDTAVVFGGSSDYFTAPDAPSLAFGNGPLSIEFWAKRGGTLGTVQVVFFKGGQGDAYFDTDDTLVYGNTVSAIAKTSVATTDANWHHFVISRLGSGAGQTRIYRDGVDVTVDVTPGATVATAVDNVWLGYFPSVGFALNGGLDEVALYPTALSAARVTAHYVAGNSASRLIRQSGKKLSAGVGFAGLLRRSASRVVAAGLSFVGSFARSRFSTLTANLSFVGAQSRRTSKALAGGLSFIGTQSRQIGKALTAALTFSGSIAKAARRTSSASLSFAGAIAKRSGRTLTGGLSFVGAIAKSTARALAAALSFTGAIANRTARALTAALSFSGAFNAVKNGGAIAYTATLTAALSFSGALAKRTNRTLTASVSFAGAIAKRTGRTLTAALSFVGSLAKRTGKSLTGGLSFAGSVLRSIGRALTASLSFAGSLVKLTARTLAGALSFSGLFNAVKNGGAIAYTQTLTAALTFSGALAKRTSRSLSAVLSFTGAIAKTTGKAFAGALSFAGAIAKRTGRTLTGGLSFVGALAKRAGKAFTGGLSFAGSLLRSIGKALTGALSFAGSLVKRVAKSLAGALSFTSLFNAVKTGGSVAYSQTFTAALTFTGAIAKRTSRTFTAALTFAGAVAKSVPRSFTGAVSFVGSLTRTHGFNRTLTAALSFTGAIARRAGKALSATLSFAGSISRAFRFTLTAALGFAGVVARGIRRTFTATLSFIGFMTSGAGFITGGLGPSISSAATSLARAIASTFRPGGGASGPTPGGSASNPKPRR